MISHLRGSVIRCAGGAMTVMTAAGVGYEVIVGPVWAPTELPNGVWIWQIFGEDRQLMYGFPTYEDRAMAILLATTPTVGPTRASRLVQAMGHAAAAAAIAAGDAKALSKNSSGLGSKSAAAIITALKNEFHGTAASPLISEVRAALAQVFTHVDETALGEALKACPDGPATAVVREYMARQ